jgi:hypothetical protein
VNWEQVVKTAESCQKTWGMGFPVISIKLLEPYRRSVRSAFRRLLNENATLKAELAELKKEKDVLLREV